MMTKENNTWKALTQSFTEDMHNVLLQQHHAVQFIALAGRYLIPQQADDSITNMQYLANREWLIGNELSGGLRMALPLSELKLCIIDQEMSCISEIPLAGLTKQQVFEQMKQNLAESNLDVSALKNELHYTLPDHELDSNAAFSTGDQKSIQENTYYRHNAEIVIANMASNFEKAEPVRIWPHHFDTGTFIPLRYNSNGGISRSIGLGWAMPDDMVYEPYYYLSFWSEDPVEDFNALPNLEAGEWIRSGWYGAVARNTDIIKISSANGQLAFVETFFNSGIRGLREHYNL
jgi:hypothetical protein